ncbi:MAG: glycosyltransferase [Candidatus Kerfeldbacteria bacterium]|nr:glycosyltransferase [Candidatus Kerfeldbacteria bacterium]
MTKPTVLVIAPTPYFSDRGCHIRIYEETKIIQSLGYHVTMVTYPLGRDLGTATIQRTKALPWYHKTTAGPAWSKLLLDIQLGWLAYRAIKKDRPILIHAHLHESMWLAWLLKQRWHIPVVLDLQSSLPAELKSYGGIWKLLAPLAKWYERWALWVADVVIASSAKVSPQAIVVADGIASRLTTAVTQQYDLVYSGGIGKQKGTDQLFQALEIIAQQRPITVLIIAQGKPQQLPPYITWLEHVPYEQLLPLLAKAKIGIEPKPLHSTEGSGKLLNYLAAGITPVTLPVDGPTAAGLARDIIAVLAGQPSKPVTYVTWESNAAILKQVYASALR